MRMSERNFRTPSIVTVTINPAIDQTVFLSDLRPGQVNRARTMRTNAGGKGVNVAACLADYGVSVAATGLLGAENDAAFVAHLKERGIEDQFLRVPGRTRVGLKIVDEAAGVTTDINLPGPTPPPRDVVRLEQQIALSVRAGRWIVLSGSLPPGVRPGWYADCIREIKGRGGRVALDTSGDPLRLGVEAGPDLVKPNADELRDLVDDAPASDEDLLDAALRLADKGIGTVVVSMGPRGALFLENGRVVRAHPLAVDVTSTVAAGDAMVAGMLSGWLEGLDLPARARLATAFAAHVLTRTGAGIDRDRVAELCSRVHVARIPRYLRARR